MGELLPEFWVGPKETREIGHRKTDKTGTQSTDIFKRLQFFGTYVVVLSPSEPHTVPELMAYMGIIIRVSQDYDGLGWVWYDLAFRRQAALSGNKKWSVVNSTLFMMKLSGRAAGAKQCELCFATSHNERECAQSGNPDPDLNERLRSLETVMITMVKSPPGLDNGRAMRPSGEACRKWNPSGCIFPRCRHLHVCSGCGGNHPVVRCGGPGPVTRVPNRLPNRPY